MVEILAGRKEEGISLLEKHNAGGMYDIRIANTLLSLTSSDPKENRNRYDKAMDYLSGSLLDNIGNLIMIAVTRINAVEKGMQNDYLEAEELALSTANFLDSLFGKDGTSPFYKYTVMLYGGLAVLSYHAGHSEHGEMYLREAFERAKQFDETKHHDVIRYTHFLDQHKPAFADDFGESAMDGLVSLVKDNADVSLQMKEAFYGMYSKDN